MFITTLNKKALIVITIILHVGEMTGTSEIEFTATRTTEISKAIIRFLPGGIIVVCWLCIQRLFVMELVALTSGTILITILAMFFVMIVFLLIIPAVYVVDKWGFSYIIIALIICIIIFALIVHFVFLSAPYFSLYMFLIFILAVDENWLFIFIEQ